MKHQEYTLNNGFKTLLYEDNSNALINLQLFVKIGSCWETENEAGFSHFLEHLVFKSTQKFPKNSLMKKASQLGASINAFTEYDSTCFYFTVPSEYLNEAMDILAQLVRFSNFSEEDFMSERLVVIEELKQYRNDIEDYFLEQLPSFYFKKSPYKKPIIGSESSLKSAHYNNLVDFYHKYYQPSNCILCISGDINMMNTKKSIKRFFGQWQDMHSLISQHSTAYHKSYPPQYLFPSDDDSSNTETINISSYFHFSQKSKNNQLAFILPEISDRSPLSYALTLINKAFAIGKKSRLYKRLFLKEKLVDSIKVHSISGICNGISVILIHLRHSSDAYKVIQIFIEELNQLLSQGLDLDELENNLKEMLHSYHYTFEFIESVGLSMGTEELLGDYTQFFRYEELIKKLSHKDLIDTLRSFYNPKFLKIVSAGKQELDHLQIDQMIKKKINGININYSNDESYIIHQLPNGIKLFLKKLHGKKICASSLAIKSSQLNENETELGINQLCASMLLHGNKKRNHEKFLEYCSNHGIQFSISCSKENTKIKFKCFNDQLRESLTLYKDILENPLFPKDHFLNLQKSFINNIKRLIDFPQTMSIYRWKQMMFGEHSNLLSKDGQIETLANIKINQCIDWYEKNFLNNEAYLVILGDFDFSEILHTCNQVFTFGNYNRSLNDYHILLNNDSQKLRIFNGDSDQSIINIGGFSCNSSETEKKTALLVLSQILGGEINSRLFEELREKRALAYSTEFDFEALEKIGYYDIFSIVDKERENEAIDAIHHVLESIVKKGVTKSEIEIAKKFIKGQSRIDEESILSQAQVLSSIFLAKKDYDYFLNRENRLQMVNRDIIFEIAKEYFNQDNFHTLIYR